MHIKCTRTAQIVWLLSIAQYVIEGIAKVAQNHVGGKFEIGQKGFPGASAIRWLFLELFRGYD